MSVGEKQISSLPLKNNTFLAVKSPFLSLAPKWNYINLKFYKIYLEQKRKGHFSFSGKYLRVYSTFRVLVKVMTHSSASGFCGQGLGCGSENKNKLHESKCVSTIRINMQHMAISLTTTIRESEFID